MKYMKSKLFELVSFFGCCRIVASAIMFFQKDSSFYSVTAVIITCLCSEFPSYLGVRQNTCKTIEVFCSKDRYHLKGWNLKNCNDIHKFLLSMPMQLR